MIKKTILFCALFIFSLGILNAQKEDCNLKLSTFHENVKAKKYKDAYEPWLYVRTQCPDLNIAIYADGEKILKYKIENSVDELKIGFLQDLITLWKERQLYFTNRTAKGEYETKICQLQYDYKDEFGKTNDELYNCFNNAFKADLETFTHPKSLYSYFSLMVDLFEADKQTDAELFNTYDDISEKIQVEIQNYSLKLNQLVSKIEIGEILSAKEKNRKKVYESYLKNYALIQGNIDAILSTKANCDNLIPLYTKDFEAII